VSDGSRWFEQLEARLEQQLEAFLRANPEQEALLQEQDQREQQQAKRRRRQQQLQQAEALRAELLQLAAEIQQWQGRVERARQAGALELAERAEQQLSELMERGRQRWQQLAQLGQAVAAEPEPEPEPEPTAETQTPPAAAAAGAEPLEQAWARFETDQELEALRRRQGSR